MKMQIQVLLLICFAGAFRTVPAVSEESGGTLHFLEAEEDWSDWTPCDNTLEMSGPVRVRLAPGGDSVKAYSLGSGATVPVTLAATLERPYRLLVDYDRDGRYGEDEVYTSTQEDVEFGDFPDVRLPMRIGEGTRGVRVKAQTYFRPKNRPPRVYVSRILDRYEGLITVEGQTYGAEIRFHSPFPEKDVVNEIIVLDADGNGEFDRAGDPWFPARGIGYVNGSLYIVGTTFDGDQAEVKLEPYSGATGRLIFAGSGFSCCRVTVDVDDPPEGVMAGPHTITLTANEQASYPLPVGAFTIRDLALRDPTLPEELNRFYLLSCENEAPPFSGRIKAGESAMLSVGGPVAARVSVNMNPKEGVVYIQDHWYEDRFGHEYRGGYSYRGSMQPGFKVLDVTGTVVYEGTYNLEADEQDCAGFYRARCGTIEWPSSAQGEYTAVPISPNPAFVNVASATFTLPSSRPGFVPQWREWDGSSPVETPKSSSWRNIFGWFRR